MEDSKETKKVIIRRNRVRTVYHHHLTIWVYPSEWDRLKYLSAGCNKTVSRYIIDKVLACKVKTPKDIVRDKSVKGMVKPLSFEEHEFDIMKEKVEQSGLGTTEYLLNVALAED